QFERELAAERVRDKVAASRRKGIWTGGSVPLGYNAKDKKLVINKVEAETVRNIFRLYLELGSFSKLVAELDRRKIVTKRRNVKFSDSGAMLQGKLFDDKGNRMGPSFSSKNGVRYRFYVSTALRGRKEKAGSVTRIPAPEIEGLIQIALSEKFQDSRDNVMER